MMRDENMAILKSLVSVAWADGEFHDKEREMVDALISAFEASEEQAKEVREYAATKKSLEDIPFADLSYDDTISVLQNAVLLTFVDGEQHESEKKLVEDLALKLGFPPEMSAPIITAAEARAKRFLNLL